jgi:hypothetical protein
MNERHERDALGKEPGAGGYSGCRTSRENWYVANQLLLLQSWREALS